MSVEHGVLVLLAKSLGLLCFIVASVLVLVYVLRPASRDTFRRAGESIIDADDRPLQPDSAGAVAAGEPKAAGPKAAGPNAAGPRATGPVSAGPASTGPGSTGPSSTMSASNMNESAGSASHGKP